jgi:hypothetical protein
MARRALVDPGLAVMAPPKDFTGSLQARFRTGQPLVSAGKIAKG